MAFGVRQAVERHVYAGLLTPLAGFVSAHSSQDVLSEF